MTRLETRGIREYFKEAVENAAQRLRVEISSHTEFYLVDLLFRYTKETRLPVEGTSFAELFLESSELEGDRRARVLKYIGDTTLFLTGFFSDSFQRSVVDVDYYAGLGRASYRNLLDLLAARVIDWSLEDTFDELSENFIACSDVLAEVSDSEPARGASGLLRIYERWVRTRSRRDEALLRQRGIIPVNFTSPGILH